MLLSWSIKNILALSIINHTPQHLKENTSHSISLDHFSEYWSITSGTNILISLHFCLHPSNIDLLLRRIEDLFPLPPPFSFLPTKKNNIIILLSFGKSKIVPEKYSNCNYRSSKRCGIFDLSVATEEGCKLDCLDGALRGEK